MWAILKKYLDHKLIRPFRDSKSPISEVASGAMIGVFWAMTPLVGLQMTLVTANWFIFRLFKNRFSLPIAMAMVWISNPLTMGPLYYFFYLAGYYFFIFLKIDIIQISYTNFTDRLEQSLSMGGVDGTLDFIYYIIRDLGWPMLIGGFVVAIPTSILAYFIARDMINKIRSRNARKSGLTLAEWEHKFVKVRIKAVEVIRKEELIEGRFHSHDPAKTESEALHNLHISHPIEEHGEPDWSEHQIQKIATAKINKIKTQQKTARKVAKKKVSKTNEISKIIGKKKSSTKRSTNKK